MRLSWFRILFPLAIVFAAAISQLSAQEQQSTFFLPGTPDIAQGKTIAQTVCAACHGPDGNSTINTNPKIAGQHAEYLFKQLKDFKSGQRVNAVMQGMVANLSDADMVNLAAFYAIQQYQPESALPDKVAEGERLFKAGNRSKQLPACAACHGPTGQGYPSLFPRIAGQFREYTEAQLRAFRSQERRNDTSHMMRDVALKMTDEEIKVVANYIAGLKK